ncbi:MAG: gamma-glutamyltransferase [Pseudomonadota bacterium]
MTRVGVAASSQLAADAGVEMATAGGNAVDAAVASSLVQVVTEPGVVSLGAAAYIVIWPPGGEPIMIDGAAEMPGREAEPAQFGSGGIDRVLPYGGGTPTKLGYGSVATPGAIAAYELAAARYGRLPWRVLVQPAIRAAREGFPMPRASVQYLSTTHEALFGWNPPAFEPLSNAEGQLLQAGETVTLPALAESLSVLAQNGARDFYEGEIAEKIASDMAAHGGLLGAADLAAYEATCVPALTVQLDDWHLATAAAPSLGGAALAAMLMMTNGAAHNTWTRDLASEIVRVQSAVMRYRQQNLDRSMELGRDIETLLETAKGNPGALASPSTVHVSSADSERLTCAITASAGYGSGVMPPGTGIWMNNSLGEAELTRHGFHALRPGARLPSNMAPTVGMGPDKVLAIGSPGADRITTAIFQTLINHVHLGMPIQDAINHPRLHVEWPDDQTPQVAWEPGLPLRDWDGPQRTFDHLDMFFGGAGAVTFASPDRFELAADVRRNGGTAVSD